MDKRKREILLGCFAVLLILTYVSGCSSTSQTVYSKPRIKDSFARATMPQPFYKPVQPVEQELSNMPMYEVEESPNPVLHDKVGTKNYTSHYVSKGDTLYSIGRKYNISHLELAALNNISDLNSIQVGQVLRVPGTGEKTSSYVAPKPQVVKKPVKKEVIAKKEPKNYKPVAVSAVRQTTTYAIHVVQQGETLYNISKKYDVSKQDICSINGISENVVLEQGQRIKIPVE